MNWWEEWEGAKREGEERVSIAGKALTLCRSKIAWIVWLQNNSLFVPGPNFNHSGWIIHSRPMTCRNGDKESLLYFDSHNKFMTPCLKGGRNRQRRGKAGGNNRGLRSGYERRRVWNKDETGRIRGRETGDWGIKNGKACGGFGNKYVKVASLKKSTHMKAQLTLHINPGKLRDRLTACKYWPRFKTLYYIIIIIFFSWKWHLCFTKKCGSYHFRGLYIHYTCHNITYSFWM